MSEQHEISPGARMILRVEIDEVRRTLDKHFFDHFKIVQERLREIVTPEKLLAMIDEEVQRVMHEVARDTARAFAREQAQAVMARFMADPMAKRAVKKAFEQAVLAAMEKMT